MTFYRPRVLQWRRWSELNWTELNQSTDSATTKKTLSATELADHTALQSDLKHFVKRLVLFSDKKAEKQPILIYNCTMTERWLRDSTSIDSHACKRVKIYHQLKATTSLQVCQQKTDYKPWRQVWHRLLKYNTLTRTNTSSDTDTDIDTDSE